jgi:sialidase-1
MFECQELFTARTEGYHIYRIPGIQLAPGGTLLATCEARRGEGGDWDPIDILMRRSLDGGKNWLPAVRLFSAADFGPGPLNNIVLAPNVRNGAIHMLFCHDYQHVFQATSTDEGETFSQLREISPVFEEFYRDYPWKVIALGPGHATTLRNGRIIIPLWLSDGTGTEFGPGLRGHRPSCTAVVYSDDGGESWERGEIAVPVDGYDNPSEAVCVEMEDGRLLLNVRSESPRNRRLVTISPDGARDWSRPEYHPELLEPVCMAALVRHSFRDGGSPGRILFANPDILEREFANWGGAICDRKRLSVKMSRDDGVTWPVTRVVEEGPAGYSDLAVLPGGEVLLFYECGMLEHMGDTRTLALARFDLNWLEGKDEI